MTTVEFTVDYALNSSLVENVYHNANKNSVVLNLNGQLYRYNNVPADEVAALVNARSAGAHYNNLFKGRYGVGTHLGRVNLAYFKRVQPVRSGTIAPKNLTPVTTAHSLQPVTPAKVSAGGPRYTVVFNGGKTYEVGEAADLAAAIVEFNDVAGKFLASVKVEKVIIDFTEAK